VPLTPKLASPVERSVASSAEKVAIDSRKGESTGSFTIWNW
jgi:hypothetical protein